MQIKRDSQLIRQRLRILFLLRRFFTFASNCHKNYALLKTSPILSSRGWLLDGMYAKRSSVQPTLRWVPSSNFHFFQHRTIGALAAPRSHTKAQCTSCSLLQAKRASPRKLFSVAQYIMWKFPAARSAARLQLRSLFTIWPTKI